MNTETSDTREAFTGFDETYERIPIERLAPSKTNPRTHFDEAYLTQLAASVAEKGVLEPVLVRPLKKPSTYEIVAGECRFRAAQRAGLTHLPALIRPYTDEQVLEIQLIENLHRHDLRPLEQAKGFRALIDANPTKHSAESIATRIGMSPAWVWDRMKLLDLVPEARKILQEERISVGHAILIARLKPEDQQRTIAFDDDNSTQYRGVGLWRPDSGFEFDEADPANKGKKPGRYDGLKPCSVRELEAWINDHIRFDVQHAAQAQPLTFEPLAAKVEERAAQPGRGKKIIAIAFDHFTPPDARSEDERTYGPKSFKFADGQKHTDDYPRRTYTAPTCEYAVLGVVAAGAGRGDAFDVCIARDKCHVHWGKEIKAREKNQKLRESGKTKQADKREAVQAARAQREEHDREQKRKTFDRLKSALRVAAAARIDGMKTVSPAVLAAALKSLGLPVVRADKLPTMLLEVANRQTFERAYGFYDQARLVRWARAIGVDVKACEPKAEVLQATGVKAKKTAKGKKAAA